MEDVFEPSAQTMDYDIPSDDDTFSDNHENAGDSPLPNDPFSDDHTTISTNHLQHHTPFTSTSHLLPPSPPSDEDMDMNESSSQSVQRKAQSSVIHHPSLMKTWGLRTLAWTQHPVVTHPYRSSSRSASLRVITVEASDVGTGVSMSTHPLVLQWNTYLSTMLTSVWHTPSWFRPS